MINIRFVTHNDPLSALIRLQAGLCVPFTPSHCEALSRDGKSYLGQRLNGGMKARPIGYDAATVMVMADGRKAERLVSLPCTPKQEAAFYAYLESKIGQPYDWKCIFDFINPAMNLHDFNHLICSAIMTNGLRTKECQWFPMPLTVPFHRISPRDLFLMLSGHVQVDH